MYRRFGWAGGCQWQMGLEVLADSDDDQQTQTLPQKLHKFTLFWKKLWIKG